MLGDAKERGGVFCCHGGVGNHNCLRVEVGMKLLNLKLSIKSKLISSESVISRSWVPF